MSRTKEKYKFTWDKGLNYETAIENIGNNLIKHAYEAKTTGNISEWNKFFYDCVLLTQGANGSRVSEALEAVYRFMKTWKLEHKVYVRKTKRKVHTEEDVFYTEGVYRPMHIPQQLTHFKRELETCMYLYVEPDKIYKEKTTTEKFNRMLARVKMYCIREYGHNTHSLRYAFITWLAVKHKVPLQVIQKITMHQDANMLFHYTQSKVAELLLEKIAKKIDMYKKSVGV